MRTALAFITATRQDAELHAALTRAAAGRDLEAIVALAQEHGFDLSDEDLRRAFAVDWGLRWARYQAS
jgi:predicted ribosomally synthesized peptide with nif11-like leader